MQVVNDGVSVVNNTVWASGWQAAVALAVAGVANVQQNSNAPFYFGTQQNVNAFTAANSLTPHTLNANDAAAFMVGTVQGLAQSINATASPPYNPASATADGREWAIFNLDDKNSNGSFKYSGITSEYTKLIVLEDMTGQTVNDKDYDDYYWVVNVASGDLDTDADNDNVAGVYDQPNPNTIEDPKEDTAPGKYIAVHLIDPSTVQRDSNNQPIPGTGTVLAGTRFVPLGVVVNDFIPGVTRVKFVGNPSALNLWAGSQPGAGNTQIAFNTPYLVNAASSGSTAGFVSGQFSLVSGQSASIYVESLKKGGHPTVQLWVDSAGDGSDWVQVSEVEFTPLDENISCLACETGMTVTGDGQLVFDTPTVSGSGDVSSASSKGTDAQVGAPTTHLELCGNAVAVVQNDAVAIWDYVNGAGNPWQPRLPDEQGTMTQEDDAFVETDLSGTKWTFTLADDSPLNGHLIEVQPADGGQVDYTYDPATGRITQSVTTTADGYVQVANYSYDSSGNVTMSLQNGTIGTDGTITPAEGQGLGSAQYSYYAASGANGNPGDLELIQTYDPADRPADTTYYRYYEGTYVPSTTPGFDPTTNPGWADDVKFVLDSAAVERAVAFYRLASPAELDTLTDAELAPYADDYFKYDASDRVSEQDTAASGCSSAGGVGATSYSYTFSTLPDAPNDWYDEKVETRADNSKVATFYNYSGSVILQDTTSANGSQDWISYNRYDDNGNLTYAYQPSAVEGWSIDSSTDALDVTLNATTGLVEVSQYYTATTAPEYPSSGDPSVGGGVAGYLQASGVQEGSQGTPVWQSFTDYVARTAGGTTVYYTYDSTQFADASYDLSTGLGGDPHTTTCHYTFYDAGGDITGPAIRTETTVQPLVSADAHGSGTSAASTDVYDTFGRVVWSRDAAGVVSYTQYDPATGAVTEQIQDANVNYVQQTSQSEYPYPSADWQLLTAQGWETASGNYKNLVTTYVPDAQGRTILEIDPAGNATATVYDDADHETRTYPGWHFDSASGDWQTTGPVEVSREDWAGSYTESLTYSWIGALPTTTIGGLTAPAGSEDYGAGDRGRQRGRDPVPQPRPVERLGPGRPVAPVHDACRHRLLANQRKLRRQGGQLPGNRLLLR